MAVITTNANALGALNSWRAQGSEIVRRFSSWIAYRRTVRALSALSDRELDDIGIARSEIRYFADHGAK